MKYIFIISFFVIGTQVMAQVPTLDVNGAGAGAGRMVRFNDPSGLGKEAEKMDYSDIRGRYLWDDEWHSAALTLKTGNIVKVKKARLNQYTNALHYFDNDLMEREANAGLVKKITFFSDKDSLTLGTFESYSDKTATNGQFYYQILNDGKIQLLKKVTVKLFKKDYDPGIGKAEHSFVSTTNYFIRKEEKLTPLKKVNKAALFEILPEDTESEKWIADQKIKLKNEEEIIQFLSYYNQTTH